AGARVEWCGFSANELRRRVPLPTYPFERQPYWIDARGPFEGRPTSTSARSTADRPPVLEAPAAAPTDGRVPTQIGYVAPRDETERRLAEIWQRLLGIHIDIHANFFELGGHSLLAAQLFAVCEKTFGRRLPLSRLVHAPTVPRLP